MRCEEIMKRDIECMTPQQTVQDAASRMREANVGFLPVCDQQGHVVGALTDRDLAIRVLAEGRDGSTAVHDVLTPEAVTCSPEDDLIEAAQLMAQNHKSRIMCVDDDGTLVGVISLSDLAQLGDQAEAGRTLRDIAEREA